jgi:signal transduction histidine kinase
MTQRFCEIKADLDRQVNERSRQLVRSERLAGVGFLAAGVAHEINNPLSAISMASESLANRVAGSEGTGLTISADDADVARQYLEMIQTEAARCQEITSRLLNFARGQDAPRGRQDVTRIIHDVVQMVGHMGKYSGHHIEFVPTSAVHAEINGSEIKQVILNLVANSLESMGTSGGRLAIEVKELSDEVCLTFTDTGCGMTARVLENLFEPFFTERKSGRGTGLGLSISHRIVTDHGGRIEAQSDGPGLGSTFRVHLPKRASQSMAA